MRVERRLAVLAWSLTGLYVVLLGLTLWGDAMLYARHAPPSHPSAAWFGLHGPWLGPFLMFAIMGAIIASKRPRNTLGWVLLASPLAVVCGEGAATYAKVVIGASPADPPALGVAASLPEEPVTVAGVLLGVVFVPLLFPDGKLPSPRWRPVVWLAVVLLMSMLVASLVSPRLSDVIVLVDGTPIEVYDVANPIAIGALDGLLGALPDLDNLILALIVAAGAAVVVRFRRSRGVEREQMKWFLLAAVAVTLALILVLGLSATSPELEFASLFVLAIGLSAYPAAIAVAVLRYRLYEIDRLISRTVSYGLVVTVLAGVYVIGVVGVGSAVTAATGRSESDAAVAVSVLVVAALFRPLRARMQTLVDRRFNRTGFEARLAVEGLAHRVRDEVDLASLEREVTHAAAAAMQPTRVSIWLPDRGGGTHP